MSNLNDKTKAPPGYVILVNQFGEYAFRHNRFHISFEYETKKEAIKKAWRNYESRQKDKVVKWIKVQ